MAAYYNEFDPTAAAWLRNLIQAGHIAPGEVDERSIEDVAPDDLRGFTQCHWFAGVGVWSYALRAAGWPDDRPVWTGSCPCQPFSVAGKGDGFADERHLWPAWFHLIGQHCPAVLFGEQVASKDSDPWVDLVHTDLEALGYAFGAIPFPAAGVGAPHIRDRLYWVADTDSGAGRQRGADVRGRAAGSDAQPWAGSGGRGVPGRLADAWGGSDRSQEQAADHEKQEADRSADQPGGRCISLGGLADADNERRDGLDPLLQWEGTRRIAGGGVEAVGRGPTNGFWRATDWLSCRDDRWRPVEPGTFPLVASAPGGLGRVRADQERIASLPRKDQGSRVARLRGYGNAINAAAAVAFIEAYLGV